MDFRIPFSPLLSLGLVTAHISEVILYRQLLDQCWGILKGNLSASFPSSSRSHPSQQVIVFPAGTSYPWDFWRIVVVPTLTELVSVTPQYVGGWTNPMARTLVSGYLKKNLQASPTWYNWVSFDG